MSNYYYTANKSLLSINVNAFITEWQVDSNDVITLPTTSAGNNYTVDWGDGSSIETVNTSTAPSHTYTTGGTYQITLSGTCPIFNINNSMVNRDTLRKVIQWGEMSFTILNFRGSGLTEIPNGPMTGTEGIADMNFSFLNCNLTDIPFNIFYETPQVNSFFATFEGNDFTSIPNNLFDNQTSLTNLTSVFKNCTSVVGDVPAYWLLNPNPPDYNTGNPNGMDFYQNVTGASNFASIPIHWK